MAATNKTAPDNLPVFIDDDKPSWLGDFNDAMTKIQAALNELRLANDTQNTNMISQASRITALENK